MILTVLISNLFFAQAVLEHSYNNPNSISTDDLFFTFYSEDGLKYFTYDKTTKIFNIYDEQHSFIKTFTAPISTSDYLFDNIVVTDKLFNSDSNFEFLIPSFSNIGGPTKIFLIDDNGGVIQEFDDRYHFKFYKSSVDGYKMVIKNTFPDVVDVYALSGVLSIEQETSLSKMMLYPNPSVDYINIQNNNIYNKALVQVYSLKGEKVLVKEFKAGVKELRIDVKNLASGTYIYILNGVSKKFVKR